MISCLTGYHWLVGYSRKAGPILAKTHQWYQHGGIVSGTGRGSFWRAEEKTSILRYVTLCYNRPTEIVIPGYKRGSGYIYVWGM